MGLHSLLLVLLPILIFVPRMQTLILRRCRQRLSMIINGVHDPDLNIPKSIKSNAPRIFSTGADTSEASNNGKRAFTFKDLPDETLYILDGTAMLFNSYYSKKRLIYGNSYLTTEATVSAIQNERIQDI